MFPGQLCSHQQRGHKYQHQRDSCILNEGGQTSRLIKRATINGTASWQFPTVENEQYRGPASVERFRDGTESIYRHQQNNTDDIG